MENRNQIFEEIDLYLKGQLSGYEKVRFEERLLTDPEFSKQVKAHQVANKVIMTRQLDLLKRRMEKDLSTNVNSGKYSKGLWALGIGLIIIMGIKFLYPFSDSDKKEKEILVSTKSSMSEVSEKMNSTKGENQILSKTKRKRNEPEFIHKKQDEFNTDYGEDFNKEQVIVVESKENQEHLPLPLNTQTSVVDKATRCSDLPRLSNADISASCKGKSDGSIILDVQHVKGGLAPYVYSFDEGKSFSDNYIFRQLEAGNYEILVKDYNGCIGNYTAIVPEKKCQDIMNYVLNPYNSNLVIPVAENRSGEIKIFSKTGILVFSKPISENQIEWDGRSDSGNILAQGYYAFVIHFDNGEEETGYISIMY